jgi:flagellar protein FlgJ
VIAVPANLLAAIGPQDFPLGMSPAAAGLESGGFHSMLEQELNRRMELKEETGCKTPTALLQTPEQKLLDLERAARGLEGLFLTQMLKAMDRTVPRDGMFSSSFASRITRDLFFEKVGEELAAAGGIGLASILRKQLELKISPAGDGDLAFKL